MTRSMERPSVILLLTILASTVQSSSVLDLLPRDSTCPTSYSKCSGSGLPNNFCCSSDSDCISLDDASSVICCPKGESCTYIQPITCNIQLQNATTHPTNPIKTTRTDDSLPKCGDQCCPFGYKCRGGNVCEIDQSKASTAIASPTSSSSTSDSTSTSTSATPDTSSTATPTIISPSDPKITSTASKNSLTDDHSTAAAAALTATTSSCPSYPSKAVAAGFFPGAIFGAALAFLGLFGFRKYREKHLPPGAKVAQYTQRSSSGTLLGISGPIPSEDTSYRTDFLLRQPAKRNSHGSRSMLHRSRSRVRSLFNSNPKITVSDAEADKVPPLPLQLPQHLHFQPQNQTQAQSQPQPQPPPPVTPPRRVRPARQPSTESIRVYSPPGTFASTNVLKPDPYALASFRPNTRFSDMIDRCGFKDSKGAPCYRVTPAQSPSPSRGLRVPRG